MLLALSIVALVNVVLLVVACCMLYFLMKKRMQQSVAAGIPCPGTTDVEKGSDAITTETAAAPDHQHAPSIGLGQSAYSLRSLNSGKLCPTPKRTSFGGARRADILNKTFASSMSSLGQSLEGLANLNAQLEALKNQRNNLNETFTSSRASLDVLNHCVVISEEEDGDSGYGSGLSSEALGKALDEVLGLYNNLEADLKPTRPRSTMSLSLPRLIHTPARHPSSTGITLDPNCLHMEF